jgi:cytochrome c-type biogenesis protein CcmF
MTPGQTVSARGYDFRFEGVERVPGPNYLADRATVTVTRGDRVIELHPEKRAYASGGQVMAEAAIDWGLIRDVYVALGEPLDAAGNSWALRIYVKPMIRWIWLGALLMAIGGFVVAGDRRFRARPLAEKAA